MRMDVVVNSFVGNLLLDGKLLKGIVGNISAVVTETKSIVTHTKGVRLRDRI